MLPFSYALRNLWRRGGRTLVTLAGIALVSLLVVLMAGFASGLSGAASETAREDVVIVTGTTGESDMVRSVIARGAAEQVAAGLPSVKTIRGERAVSIELHIATRTAEGRIGLLRGVTPGAYLVHDKVTLIEGREPSGPFELLAGRLAASRMGFEEAHLRPGSTIELEKRTWTIVGRFAAPGTMLEAEMWGRLDDIVMAVGRIDVSCVAARLESPEKMKEVSLWIVRNASAFEVSWIPQTEMVASLQGAMDRIALLAWIMAGLVLIGGTFACANTMFAAVLARTREMGALRAIGYGPLAVGWSLLSESLLLGLLGGILGFWLAGLFGEVPLKFPMGAFYLYLSPTVRLGGLGAALASGLLGGIFPAWRALRLPLTDALGGKL